MSSLTSRCEIFKEYNLVIEYHSGVLDVDSFIAFKRRLTLNPSFSPNLNYFIYLKDVVFNTSEKDIYKYADFLGNNADLYGKRRVALVTSTPNQVVSSTLFKMMQKNVSQPVEVFSTNENALNWLNIKEISIKELSLILLNLKRK